MNHDAHAPDAEALCRAIAGGNPFLDNRVNTAPAAVVDVVEVHKGPFEKLTRWADEALAARRGVGAMLWGQAGIGKSHLVARLARWADDGRRASFVYLHNLQAAPDRLPRSLLQAVVSVLTRGRQSALTQTPLFRLVHAAVRAAAGAGAGAISWGQLAGLVARWIDCQSPSGGPPLDRTPYEVLYRFFCSAWRAAHRREDGAAAALAVRWLSGLPLEPAEARALGLGPVALGQVLALEDGQEIKSVLVALTHLAAAAGTPFVLVFDQVDNLDAEQMAALARFLEALLDSAANLLVITAGVENTLLGWREQGEITTSAWDRLAQFTVLLSRLAPEEALAIVRARLGAFLAPFVSVPEVAKLRQDDPLFPLGQHWQRRWFADRVEARPRDVVNAAREAWQHQQELLARLGGPAWLAGWPHEGAEKVVSGPTKETDPEAVDRTVAEKIAEHVAWREHSPQTLPPDADHIAGLIYAVLRQCRDGEHRYGVIGVERVSSPRRGARPAYDLMLHLRQDAGRPPVRTGVVVVTAPSPFSVTGFLRRLIDDPRPPHRVVLVSDERVGLPLGPRGEEYLRELQQRGADAFRPVELSLRQLAELDALDQVVRQAGAGDLEIEWSPGQTRPIEVAEVLASHDRHGRYLGHRLLSILLTPAIDGAPVQA